MTKEELYAELANCETEYGFTPTDVLNMLNVFFESNICIPKGEHLLPALFACKHTQNDDDFKVVTIVKYTPNNGYYEYHDESGNSYSIAIYLERVKPSEPVYEWQWTEDGVVRTLAFYTEDEIDFKGSTTIERIHATKRVRQ